MKISSSSFFDAQYARLTKKNPGVKTLLAAALLLLQEAPRSPSLKIHKLKGNPDRYWLFSLSYDLRVIFEWKKDTILLINIGSHDEVY